MGRNCDAFGSLKGVDTTYYSNACLLAGSDYFDGAPVDHVTQQKLHESRPTTDSRSTTDRYRAGRISGGLRSESVCR